MIAKMLRPDSKGRITLGSVAYGVSGYAMYQETNGTIILKPHVEIPAQEQWLFKNKSALHKVQVGLAQAKNNDLVDRGSFSQFSDDEVE
jgi:hypothetical protein